MTIDDTEVKRSLTPTSAQVCNAYRAVGEGHSLQKRWPVGIAKATIRVRTHVI